MPMRRAKQVTPAVNGPSARLDVPVEAGATLEEKSAKFITEGIASNAFIAMQFLQHSGMAGGNELNELVKSTRVAVEDAAKGGTGQADALLTSQAIALNSVFLEMSRRAALNMGEHLGAMETYMRLALKAQAQCRSTLETLAEIHNPKSVAFVKQANIAGGHQQINNGTGPGEATAADPTREQNNFEQSKLLEETPNGQWLDTGTTPSTVDGDPQMAPMGALNRAADCRRKGQGG